MASALLRRSGAELPAGSRGRDPGQEVRGLSFLAFVCGDNRQTCFIFILQPCSVIAIKVQDVYGNAVISAFPLVGLSDMFMGTPFSQKNIHNNGVPTCSRSAKPLVQMAIFPIHLLLDLGCSGLYSKQDLDPFSCFTQCSKVTNPPRYGIIDRNRSHDARCVGWLEFAWLKNDGLCRWWNERQLSL